MSKPLENIRVLDLTRVLAGPFCTMILSDLGAEIVKVEKPFTGDDSRSFGPFHEQRSLYFISINRGKKSVSLNLKHPKGKQMLLDLVSHFDVLTENFRPGTMEKLGLGYDVLKEVNPRLIYASSSGFGHSGPYSPLPAYDILVQAMGGIMSITGWKGSPPTRVGMSLGDITASLFTATGITSALYHRERTGKGQKIDIAMLDCQVAILENALLRLQAEGLSPEPLGNRHPTISPFQAYKGADGEYFVLAIGNDSLWKVFCQAMQKPGLLEDKRFKTNKLRTENLAELNAILEPVFLTKTSQEWLALFAKTQIPTAPINDIAKVMEDPQVKARQMIVAVKDKEAGKVKIAGNPIKMTSIPDSDTRPDAPEIGEHNYDIYTKMLDISNSEVEILKSEGVI